MTISNCADKTRCVPKKMTWNFASINEAIKYAKPYCYNIPDGVTFDYGAFVEKRDARIKVLNGIYETNWEKEGIELIHGTAKFINKNELEIDLKDGSGKTRVTAPHICIATGSFPTKPSDIKGAEYGITSDDFFKIKKLPKKMVFVGAGYISVELAGVMNALGVETHMFIRGDTFLRKFEDMLQNALTAHYEEAGVIIHKQHSGIKEVVQLQAAASDADPSSKKLKIISNDGSELECNELLWAIGRAPQMKGLDVAQSGIELGKRGHIVVDEFQNTTVPGIYALGDVTGQAELTPVAIAAGRQLGNRLFGPPHLSSSKLDYDRIPTVIFSHPEVSSRSLLPNIRLTINSVVALASPRRRPSRNSEPTRSKHIRLHSRGCSLMSLTPKRRPSIQPITNLSAKVPSSGCAAFISWVSMILSQFLPAGMWLMFDHR